jgi:hypothetical protein
VNIPDIVALLMALAGLVIVVGSFFLLYRGIITLTEVNKLVAGKSSRSRTVEQGDQNSEEQGQAALSLQLGDKIKVRSQYPTLCLFILGILCFVGSLWYLNSPSSVDAAIQRKLKKLQEASMTMVRGHVNVPDTRKYSFVLSGDLGTTKPDVNGFVERSIPTDINEVDVTVARGGGEPDQFVLRPSESKNGVLSFEYPSASPSLSVTPSPTPTITSQASPSNSSQVAPTPTGFPTPLFGK